MATATMIKSESDNESASESKTSGNCSTRPETSSIAPAGGMQHASAANHVLQLISCQ